MTTIQRTFRAEERLILDAEALAQTRGMTLSDVVRMALRGELERNYEARLTRLASELGAGDCEGTAHPQSGRNAFQG